MNSYTRWDELSAADVSSQVRHLILTSLCHSLSVTLTVTVTVTAPAA